MVVLYVPYNYMDFLSSQDHPPTHLGVRYVSISGHDIAVDQAAQFFTRYIIKVMLSNGKTELIPRRYRQFRVLHEAVRALPASERPSRSELPAITSKKWGGANTPELVEKRTRKLHDYLVSLSSIALLFPAVDKCLQDFFTAADVDDVSGDGHDDDDGDLAGAGPSDEPDAAVGRPGRTSISAAGSARMSLVTQALAPSATTEHAMDAPGEDGSIEGRCAACDKVLSAAPTPSANPDAGLFCSPQCERFYSAALHKGFKIAAIGGKRQIASAASVADWDAHTPPVDYAATHHTKLGTIKSGTSTWWGSARKVLGGATPPVPSTSPRGGAGTDSIEPRRSSSGVEEGSDGRKDASDSRGSGAAASSGDEVEGGMPTVRSDLGGGDDEHHKFFRDRRKERDSTRVLTKWGSLRNLMSASRALSHSNSSAKSARDSISTPLPSSKILPVAPPRSSPSSASAINVEILNHKGFMWKRGGFKGGRKSWKWRYFELRERTLYYYGTNRSVLLGTLSLVKEPDVGVLLAAATTVLAKSTELQLTSPDFSSELFHHVASSSRSYFASIQVSSSLDYATFFSDPILRLSAITFLRS